VKRAVPSALTISVTDAATDLMFCREHRQPAVDEVATLLSACLPAYYQVARQPANRPTTPASTSPNGCRCRIVASRKVRKVVKSKTAILLVAPLCGATPVSSRSARSLRVLSSRNLFTVSFVHTDTPSNRAEIRSRRCSIGCSGRPPRREPFASMPALPRGAVVTTKAYPLLGRNSNCLAISEACLPIALREGTRLAPVERRAEVDLAEIGR